jgi:hypothetical protein
MNSRLLSEIIFYRMIKNKFYVMMSKVMNLLRKINNIINQKIKY